VAYDETLAERVRAVLKDKVSPPTETVEKKMFGGLCFMVGGHMCCGISSGDLLVRVGADRHESALSQPHARPMDFTGRPMKGIVYVGSDGLAADEQLGQWVNMGLEFVQSLPPKQTRAKKPNRRKNL
jgi:TfoX/Sxy family transcriptional regulator of competence genes